MADARSTISFPGTGAIMQVEADFAGNQPDASSATTPYFNASDIKGEHIVPATATSLEVVTSIALDVVNANTFKTQIAIPVGDILRVFRVTESRYPLVDFKSIQTVSELDLDTEARQGLFLAMEATDNATRADAKSDRTQSFAIQANETAAEAVATADNALAIAQGADSKADQAIADSAAAVATANSSIAKADQAIADAAVALQAANDVNGIAQAAQDAAEAAQADAATAVSTANAVDAKAQTALDNSAEALSTANAAQSTANGIAGTANTALTTANAANSKADTAISTANAAKATADGVDAKADSAIATANTAKSSADTATANVAALQAEVTAMPHEAPNDGKIYGRKNNAWTEAISVTTATTPAIAATVAGQTVFNFPSTISAVRFVFIEGAYIQPSQYEISGSTITLLDGVNAAGDIVSILQFAVDTLTNGLSVTGTAADSSKLGGQAASYYAAASAVSALAVTTQRLHLQDQKASGTAAGASVGATYANRILNTVVTNTIPGASLDAGNVQFTLPAGTYDLEASAPALACLQHRLVVRDVAGANLFIGSAEYSNTANPSQTVSRVRRVFTIAAATTFYLAHYTTAVKAGDGLGTPTSVSPIPEVYAEVIVRRLA